MYVMNYNLNEYVLFHIINCAFIMLILCESIYFFINFCPYLTCNESGDTIELIEYVTFSALFNVDLYIMVIDILITMYNILPPPLFFSSICLMYNVNSNFVCDVYYRCHALKRHSLYLCVIIYSYHVTPYFLRVLLSY